MNELCGMSVVRFTPRGHELDERELVLLDLCVEVFGVEEEHRRLVDRIALLIHHFLQPCQVALSLELYRPAETQHSCVP